MYSSLQLAKKYLHYYLTARNGKGHGMHSPFVFDFILNVLNNKAGYQPPPQIEDLRKRLLSDRKVLEIEDFGAGSRTAPFKQRSVRQIAASALKPKKYAQLLFRLVKHYRPQTILELGTSLGITTAYFAKANPGASISTIEGSQSIAAVAHENFAALGLKNIQLLQGPFDAVLPTVILSLSKGVNLLKDVSPSKNPLSSDFHLPSSDLDLAYIDGNHRYEPTIQYLHQLLPNLRNNSVLVFDDIHWSEEMERAWEEIKAHPSVRCTVDVFFLGFVFFRQEFKTAQHFKVRY